MEIEMDVCSKTLLDFIKDYCEHLPPEIPVLNKAPTAVEFLNKYVLPNSPFIIKPSGKGFFQEAGHEWNTDYMKELMDNGNVTVAATPNGKADSIVDDKFMLPEERTMRFNTYIEDFLKPQPIHVLYVQKQNNNLIEEFPGFLKVLDKDVPWATEAFGKPPDAANIWMGDQFSVTSMHKDYYENIYFVLKGTKVFRIFPPVAIAWMPYRTVPKFQWYFDHNLDEGYSWKMKDLHEEISWIRPDLQPHTREKFRMLLNTKSYTFTLSQGQALYLPSMWFHEVDQKKETMAVNYWYDMTYEMKYPYFRLVDTLGNLPILRKDASTGIQPELEDQLIVDLLPKTTARRLQMKERPKWKI